MSTLDQLEYSGWTIAAEPVPLRLPDPDDEPFLEVALSGAVDALVTGNIAHFPVQRSGDVAVLTPAELIERYRSGIV